MPSAENNLESTSPAAAPPAGAAPPPRLQRRADGRLCVARNSEGEAAGAGAAAGAPTPVRPVRCFPWSRPGAFVSLRDDEDQEVAFVEDPAQLDPASRAALEEELAPAGFVLHIQRIVSVREELEIRIWKVETREGARTFQTSRDEWPLPLHGGSLLLRDVAGDLYLIPRAAALDPTSRRVLWAFTD
jgi:hypothetical protein